MVTFTAQGDGYTGSIKTLTLNVRVQAKKRKDGSICRLRTPVERLLPALMPMSADGAKLTLSGEHFLEHLDQVSLRTTSDPRSEIIPLDEIDLSAKRCRQLPLDARLIDQGEAFVCARRDVERQVDVREFCLGISRDRSEQVDVGQPLSTQALLKVAKDG